MPAISAIPPEAAGGGVESLAAGGDDELDPKDGGTREVLFEPAPLAVEPAPKEVLFESAVKPPKDVELDPVVELPRDVEFEPAEELALGAESESGNGGTVAPGDDALESGAAGAGEEELESGVDAAGLDALESGAAGAGEEELESGVDAAGLDELDAGAELASSLPAPGKRLLRLLGSNPFSLSMSEDTNDLTSATRPVLSDSPALPPSSPENTPPMPPPAALPAPAPGLSAEGEEASGKRAKEDAALSVVFDASGPPDVSGKGDKLSGSEFVELPASAPPRPGDVKKPPLVLLLIYEIWSDLPSFAEAEFGGLDASDLGLPPPISMPGMESPPAGLGDDKELESLSGEAAAELVKPPVAFEEE
ncbi:hypothetical protein FKW77_005246 [Venturia effusa]|uniref:Uncharacterized protein n=1 Tax=Venturia effusa TaxID=50376 RepID=A0A517L1B3_9PEZI|nr:hypothetical protein FKW77_005246 [Venturia effusa]